MKNKISVFCREGNISFDIMTEYKIEKYQILSIENKEGVSKNYIVVDDDVSCVVIQPININNIINKGKIDSNINWNETVEWIFSSNKGKSD